MRENITLPVRSPLLILSLLVLGLWTSGCASFPGNNLPAYTYADLAPAPAKKTCLVTHITSSLEPEDQEVLDRTIAMFEKSGFFDKAPERCSLSGEQVENSLKMGFKNEIKAGNLAVAMISGFVSGATLLIVPGYARDEFVMTMQLTRNDQLVKEYVYREHVDTWFHLSMIFMMSNNQGYAAVQEIYYRMIMNFLHDYSFDVQKAGNVTASSGVP